MSVIANHSVWKVLCRLCVGGCTQGYSILILWLCKRDRDLPVNVSTYTEPTIYVVCGRGEFSTFDSCTSPLARFPAPARNIVCGRGSEDLVLCGKHCGLIATTRHPPPRPHMTVVCLVRVARNGTCKPSYSPKHVTNWYVVRSNVWRNR